MPRSGATLGELERAVMERLWDQTSPSGLTVREVHGELADRELAYTTVMTVLDRLTKKGLVTRERDGRAWRYLPAASRGELTAEAMRTPLAALDAPERRNAMLHFLGTASPDEIDDLRAALADIEARSDDRE